MRGHDTQRYGTLRGGFLEWLLHLQEVSSLAKASSSRLDLLPPGLVFVIFGNDCRVGLRCGGPVVIINLRGRLTLGLSPAGRDPCPMVEVVRLSASAGAFGSPGPHPQEPLVYARTESALSLYPRRRDSPCTCYWPACQSSRAQGSPTPIRT